MEDNRVIKDFEENEELNIEKLVETYNSYIYSILKNSISNEEDIQEILSDVFYIFWKKYVFLEKDTKVKLYLIGIVKNLIKKKYRQYNLDYEFKNLDEIQNQCSINIEIEELVENNEKVDIISQIIDNIKYPEKEIFIMFYYQNKKVKNIAKKLNVSISKVKVSLHRLRKMVKKELKERGYNYGNK